MATEDELICNNSAMGRFWLVEFSRKFPERYFDVAIAEQHAVTFAAGLQWKIKNQLLRFTQHFAKGI